MKLMESIITRVSQYLIDLYITESAAFLVEQYCIRPTDFPGHSHSSGELKYTLIPDHAMRSVSYYSRFEELTIIF